MFFWGVPQQHALWAVLTPCTPLARPYDFDKPSYPSNEEAWKQLEALKDEGLVREIGVSNYRISDLEKTLAIAKHRPVINQASPSLIYF